MQSVLIITALYAIQAVLVAMVQHGVVVDLPPKATPAFVNVLGERAPVRLD